MARFYVDSFATCSSNEADQSVILQQCADNSRDGKSDNYYHRWKHVAIFTATERFFLGAIRMKVNNPPDLRLASSSPSLAHDGR